MLAVTATRPTIQVGSQGDAVQELQDLLNQRLGNQIVFRLFVPLRVDGDFGDRTRNAVMAYQEHYALDADGVVGDRAWTSLLQTRFPDITGHWAANYISVLANMGIVKGDELGNFRPNGLVTRRQFAQLVVAAFDRILTTVRPPILFRDVPMPARNPIYRAYETGVMAGFEDGTFRPEESILRQDVLVALVRILGMLRSGGPNDLLRYEDRAAISDYARNAVILATGHGIVVNQPNLSRLNPKAAATRAEVAAILERAIVSHVRRQAQFGNRLNLGYRVPKEPIDSPFVVRADI
jgi:peptidoglycan hydrolase-like protein with peptidoglycan-binding domain